MLALESLVAAQQDQIELLSTTLAQIESLPTIRRLLDKVRELEAKHTRVLR